MQHCVLQALTHLHQLPEDNCFISVSSCDITMKTHQQPPQSNNSSMKTSTHGILPCEETFVSSFMPEGSRLGVESRFGTVSIAQVRIT